MSETPEAATDGEQRADAFSLHPFPGIRANQSSSLRDGGGGERGRDVNKRSPPHPQHHHQSQKTEWTPTLEVESLLVHGDGEGAVILVINADHSPLSKRRQAVSHGTLHPPARIPLRFTAAPSFSPFFSLLLAFRLFPRSSHTFSLLEHGGQEGREKEAGFQGRREETGGEGWRKTVLWRSITTETKVRPDKAEHGL